MSTDTDGAPPSVSSSDPDDETGRRRAEDSMRSPSWLQEEIARRAAEMSRSGRRGRHARIDDEPSAAPPVPPAPQRPTPPSPLASAPATMLGGPPAGFGAPSSAPGQRSSRPRGGPGDSARLGMPPPHVIPPSGSAAAAPAPSTAPDARPRVVPPPATGPAPRQRPAGNGYPAARPVHPPADPLATAPIAPAPDDGRRESGRAPAAPAREQRPATLPADAAARIERVRVVLAERRRTAAPVRTVDIVAEGTGVGRLLRTSLIRAQVILALGFAAGAGVCLGALPLLLWLFPALGRAQVLDVPLPWLVLGLLVYPFLLLMGWLHTRTAERVEQGFADHVQD